jgi:hypothetical protein
LKEEIIFQYQCSLKMLIDTVRKCPADLWENDKDYMNGYSRIVYHTLFFSELHLMPATKKFVPWKKHIANYNYLAQISPVDNEPIIIEKHYSKEDMIEYAESILALFENPYEENSKDEKNSYKWLEISRVPHIYNIRHMQHHIGQLVERLHHIGIRGIEWEG